MLDATTVFGGKLACTNRKSLTVGKFLVEALEDDFKNPYR